MAPPQAEYSTLQRRANATFNGSWRKDATVNAFVIEAWGQGLMFGALMIMVCVTISNMRKGVLLHKLILLEVCQWTFDEKQLLTAGPALACDHAWHVLLYVVPWLWLVPFFYCDTTILLLVCSQHCGMDENQTLL